MSGAPRGRGGSRGLQALVAALVVLSGCPSEPEQPAPGTDERPRGGDAADTGAGSAGATNPAGTATGETGAATGETGAATGETGAATGETGAGAGGATDDPTAAPEGEGPEGFIGFSADGARFAYSVYSQGAGFHVFTVVDAVTGRRVTDIPLEGPEDLRRARALLGEGRFVGTPLSPADALAPGQRFEVGVRQGRVEAALVRPGGRVALRPGRYFEESSQHFGSPEAELWGFSPDGRRAAIRVSQFAGPELGTGVTFHVVTLPGSPPAQPAGGRADPQAP